MQQVSIDPSHHGYLQFVVVEKPVIVVVGSVNADIIIPVERLPNKGETVLARGTSDAGRMFPGGKGANQAVASCRLGAETKFVCRLGNDAHAPALQQVLIENGIDVSHSSNSEKPSGQGLVFLQDGGSVSSIVVQGSNADWRKDCSYTSLLEGASAVLLQREVPEFVNEAVADAACKLGIPVFQDIGGEERPISDKLLQQAAYVCPNETELARLTGMGTANTDQIIEAAKSLQKRGARNVLVTCGADGAILISQDKNVIRQACCPLPAPDSKVVDETGAGDAFRAAFAVATAEGRPLHTCLQFAAAAGAIAVSRMGAVPSLPRRDECEALRERAFGPAAADPAAGDSCTAAGRAASDPSAAAAAAAAADALEDDDSEFPLKFGSRLNSMKDRLDLWQGPNDVYGWVARQGLVKGLDLVDFNYPQHLSGCDLDKINEALSAAGLRAGAVCLRFPPEMRAGAYTNPDPVLRRRAVELTKEAAGWARRLGCDEVVVWSAYCGYDYHFQADYQVLWDRVVSAFREVCDSDPGIKFSLEYKPTDEHTRFFAVPTAAAALLLAREVSRDNLGLTLDFGHMLVAGENPAQSVAMAARAGKLFGVQLNDGYGRGEDGLMFGSVHTNMALEVVYWLRRSRFAGHVYFDTFPRNEDPVGEAEHNIRVFKGMWRRAGRMVAAGTEEVMGRQDGLAAMRMLERVPR